MDPNIAKTLFDVGGILIFLDVPKGTSFGIDMNVWTVDEKFKGLKMIPPGLHFIHLSAGNKGFAPRIGFFHHFGYKEVLVKKYLVETEDFINVNDETMLNKFKDNVQDLDQFLAPYPVTDWSKWVALVQFITVNDSQRMEPQSGKLCSATALEYADSSSHEDSSLSKGIKGKRGDPSLMIQQPDTAIRFTKFLQKPYKYGATPREITRGNIDASYSLNEMFNNFERPEEILAELQFSFVCFLIGEIWEGFDHWKKLIINLCKAEECLIHNTTFYSNLISVLHHQIKHVPEDLFVDITENENFLSMSIINLSANISDNITVIPKDLTVKTNKFRKFVSKRFTWNLSIEEDGENAPVVVELSKNVSSDRKIIIL